MRLKLQFRTIPAYLLLGALVLSACDSGSPTATPIPANPTATISAPVEVPTQPSDVPSDVSTPGAPQAVPSNQPAATAQPTAPSNSQNGGGNTGGSTSEDDAALVLNATTVETTDTTRVGVFEGERSLNLPQGFHIEVYAAGLDSVRWLGVSPDGMVYATVRNEGRVVTLPDADKDGKADSINTFADQLGDVHGLAFKDKAVYVANESSIIRLEDTDGDGKADKKDVLAKDLPSGSGHSTRTLAFTSDGKLLVSVGSSCNVCVEQNEKRAAISLYSAEGAFEKVFASGLRNAVGMVIHPTTGELWATNNGRDNLGDDIPPETIYNVKESVNYGWPYCYGTQIEDTETSEQGKAPEGFCGTTGVPAVQLQAHSAPLGLAFYTGDQFPASYKGDLFVAFHGSWNRSEPTGYKVVRVRFKDNMPDVNAGDLEVEDFITGWRVGGDVWGRPVDPIVAPDGSLLLTDDQADVVYRIYYAGDNTP